MFYIDEGTLRTDELRTPWGLLLVKLTVYSLRLLASAGVFGSLALLAGLTQSKLLIVGLGVAGATLFVLAAALMLVAWVIHALAFVFRPELARTLLAPGPWRELLSATAKFRQGAQSPGRSDRATTTTGEGV